MNALEEAVWALQPEAFESYGHKFILMHYARECRSENGFLLDDRRLACDRTGITRARLIVVLASLAARGLIIRAARWGPEGQNLPDALLLHFDGAPAAGWTEERIERLFQEQIGVDGCAAIQSRRNRKGQRA